jgi:hypothetical protein
MSLRNVAPRAAASCWVWGWNESTDTGMPAATNWSRTMSNRRTSSSAVTRAGPWMTSRGAEFDDISARRMQSASMRKRILRRQKPATVRERICGDVDDPYQPRPVPGHSR